METRRLGRTGFAVSVLGFGASEIGYQNVAASTVEKLLNGALDGGLNVIDSAACYDISEELIGSTVSHRRSEYHLFTNIYEMRSRFGTAGRGLDARTR
jgi:aryl-alcohol dehydrogenase-like predicted oxidoreductase